MRSPPRARWPARHQPRHRHHRHDPDRHVHEEHQPPPEVLAGDRDESAADQRTGRGGHRHRHPEQSERAGPLGAGEQLLDEPGVLRRQQPGRGALQQPRHHHELGGGRQTHRGTGDHEEREPDQHQPPASVGVAEPAAGHQREPERQRVARHHPLHRRDRGVEAGADRRDRDVDDRDVEQRHEADDERDREDPPPVRVRGGSSAILGTLVDNAGGPWRSSSASPVTCRASPSGRTPRARRCGSRWWGGCATILTERSRCTSRGRATPSTL